MQCAIRRLESFEDKSFYEFAFHITVIPDPENPEEIIEIWTPEVAGQYIPPETRPLLLRIVAECYKAFIRILGRMPIYRVSYGSKSSRRGTKKARNLKAM